MSAYDTRVLTDDRAVAEYFEAAIAAGADTKQVANWVMGDIAAYVNSNNLQDYRNRAKARNSRRIN